MEAPQFSNEYNSYRQELARQILKSIQPYLHPILGEEHRISLFNKTVPEHNFAHQMQIMRSESGATVRYKTHTPMYLRDHLFSFDTAIFGDVAYWQTTMSRDPEVTIPSLGLTGIEQIAQNGQALSELAFVSKQIIRPELPSAWYQYL